MVDPDEIARFLISVATSSVHPLRARLLACEMILDRTEGKPVQSLDLRAQLAGASSLPPHWDQMTTSERSAFLDQHVTPSLALPAGSKP
ncbi:MAG: hypothetical protein JWP01_3379 [Myxococcales bacterium]|nr:hypothetical protein [Myxococcales bacterium]